MLVSHAVHCDMVSMKPYQTARQTVDNSTIDGVVSHPLPTCKPFPLLQDGAECPEGMQKRKLYSCSNSAGSLSKRARSQTRGAGCVCMMQPARQPILSSSDGGSVHGRTQAQRSRKSFLFSQDIRILAYYVRRIA
ncbi:unnamed protein product [Cercospora beticola]|nr:unnamed protein product [Cercospora beticola]